MPAPTSDPAYKNPDNDVRGPYRLVNLTIPGERPLQQFEWLGVMPPKGRSWRVSKQKAEELEADGRIVKSASGMIYQKIYRLEKRKELQHALTDIVDNNTDTESDFIARFLPQFFRALGYAEDETLYDYGNNRRRADVVLSSSIDNRPWLVVEVKNRKVHNEGDLAYQLRSYIIEFDCDLGVALTPDVLIILADRKIEKFRLRDLTLDQIDTIDSLLDRDIQTDRQKKSKPPSSHFAKLIDDVVEARTNDAKGKTLEELASFLFSETSGLTCKYRNLKTRSSEIDIVVEYDRANEHIQLFDEIGRYALIECKNWNQPVGVSPIRDFMGKLDKCKARLGVVFSRNGVTGVDAGADALREIQSRFDRDGTYILVFSLEEVRAINGSKSFILALDKKADSLRFDVQSF